MTGTDIFVGMALNSWRQANHDGNGIVRRTPVGYLGGNGIEQFNFQPIINHDGATGIGSKLQFVP